jgi:hypothetical protein
MGSLIGGGTCLRPANAATDASRGSAAAVVAAAFGSDAADVELMEGLFEITGSQRAGTIPCRFVGGMDGSRDVRAIVQHPNRSVAAPSGV